LIVGVGHICGCAICFANEPEVVRNDPAGLPRRIVFSEISVGTQASAAFGVCQKLVGGKLADISENRDIWPVSSQDTLAVFV
jgi:hypothetical protein